MEMKNPPHPGELIGDTLDELKVSIVAAAKGLGVTRQQVHNLIAGRSGITPEMAVKLEKALGSTADTWLRMQMNYDLAQVRKRTINVTRWFQLSWRRRGLHFFVWPRLKPLEIAAA